MVSKRYIPNTIRKFPKKSLGLSKEYMEFLDKLIAREYLRKCRMRKIMEGDRWEDIR